MTAKAVNIGTILERIWRNNPAVPEKVWTAYSMGPGQRWPTPARSRGRRAAIARKILALPAVIDRGQNFIGPVSAADLKENAAAVASRLIAVQFQKPVFAGGQPGVGFQEPDRARLARRQLRQTREKRAMCARGFIEIHPQTGVETTLRIVAGPPETAPPIWLSFSDRISGPFCGGGP